MNFHGHNGPRDHPPTKPPPPGSHHHHQNQHHRPHHHHHHHQNHHPHQQPPVPHPHPDPANRPPEKWHSYKMLVDPSIHRGAPKMIRYDGTTVPGNPHHVSPMTKDPRTKLPSALWKRLEAMDLPVPKFKIDENFVGEPPKVEVTVENMNDNVDKQFLLRMIEKCGAVEDVKIYFHPVSGKHLGLAHLCFEEVKGAKECVKYLHGKSVMGQQLNCYLDPMSKSCQMMFAELTEEKKPEPLPPPVPTLPNQNPSQSEQEMDQYQPMLEEDNISPGDNHDWGHRQPPQQQHEPYPYQRRESREDPRRPSQDPRRPSQDHERRHSRDYRESSHNKYADQTDDTEMQAYEAQTTILPPAINHDDSKYQQTPFDPNYWQQEAQKYAAAAATALHTPHQPTPPPSSTNLDMSFEAPNIKDEEKIKDENDEDDHQVDLDTRLKMLMKGKAGAAMPSFLLDELNGSEGEEESEGEIKDIVSKSNNDHLVPELPPTFTPDPILSRPPSPFLSESHYQKCHDAWQNDKREKFNKLHNIGQPASKASPKSDDRMSLSSLSSGENNILQQGPLPNYYGYYPPPPGYDHQSWYTQQYMQQPGGPEGSSQWPLDYNVPHQQQHHHQNYYQNQNNVWQDPYHSIRESLKSGKSDKNVFRPVIKEAVRVVVQDLTQTLTKDINKRMCETLGFYLLDKWWAEQEQKYKEKHSNVPSVAAKSTSSSSTKPSDSSSKVHDTSDKVPKITRVEDISSFFDKQRESMETGTGLLKSGFSGLGFRGSIPKMPSFKKKVPTESKSSNKTAKKADYHSSDDNKDKKKKISDKRREQEKRREERLKKENNDHKSKSKETKESTVKASTSSSTDKSSSKTKTLSSIYSTLYSDTDESKDTELSDLDKKVGSRSPKAGSEDNEKKFKKKRSSPTIKSRKKRASSISFDDTSSSSSSEEEEETSVSESPAEERVKKKDSSDARNKKAVKKSSKIDSIDESSQGSQESVKKKNVNLSEDSSSAAVEGSSKSASSSSGSSSSSSGSSSDEEIEEEVEKKKPAVKPLRRASETLHKSDPTKVATEPKPSTPSYIAEDHCYALTPEVEDNNSPANNFENQFANDHGYTRPRTPPSKSVLKPQQHQPAPAAKKPEKLKAKPKPLPAPMPVAPKRTFKERSNAEEFDIVYKFLTKGIDLEDIKYFKVAYNLMLEQQDAPNNMSKMLNYTHWVDHTVTDIPGTPPKKKRKFDFSKPHLTGSARSEGYYKMDPREKARTKYHLQRDTNAAESSGIVNTQGAMTKAKIQSAQNMSREARSNQRRQLAVLGDEASSSDLLKFNQLKFRRKNMTFGKSAIHDWGLFAKEYIGADEMVIEYVGQVVRPVISDVREKRYEKQGIGSSYLFRIDADYVVDATKCGNLARFINHSCDPNCYAKIITIDGESKIVIYSKQPIAYGEEITYDYKFPIEDEKIRCLCGTEKCRKYLN